MTNQHLTNALQAQANTAAWMRTSQAATMAQLDEQMRGQEHGLTPGEDSAEHFTTWLHQRYGTIPDAPALDGVTPTAQAAGNLRHWQADRLADSTLVAVTGDVLAVVHRLATSGSFTTTPPIPEQLPQALTFVWPRDYRGYGSHSVTGPGGLPGEDEVCAITIDQTHQRIIEWSSTDLDFGGSTQLILDKSESDLPPWMPAGDDRYQADDLGKDQWQARIIAAAGFDSSDGRCSLLEQANAALVAVATGLVAVKKTDDGFILSPPKH